MNKQNISSIPDENQIEELLERLQPVPSKDFREKMEQADWRNEQKIPKVSTNKLRLKYAAVIVVVITTTFLGATPQGRALAQEVIQFFKQVNSTTIFLSPEEKESMFIVPEEYELPLVKVPASSLSPELAKLPECQSTQDARSYACQIAYAEAKLGFNLKEIPIQPEGWEFDSVYFDPISKTAFTSYKIDINYNSFSSLTLRQGLGSNLPSASSLFKEAAPSDRINIVKVGPYNGEYVKGEFALRSNDSELKWIDSESRQRLGWGDSERWFFIDLFASTGNAKSIGRDQLIELAESLIDEPDKRTAPLHSGFVYSVLDAEHLSGLDLKAPTLLPLGVDFSSAQYLSGSNKVILRYGINDELVIHEWKGKPTSFEPLSSTSDLDYEIVDVNGKNAFFTFSSYAYSPYWFLWWSEGEMNYQIYYYQYLSSGGVLNKEKIIAIAESMSNINDSRNTSFKPYDYVTIYEQSLGFDIKEFPTTPAGWSFSNVSAYVQPDCISIFFNAEMEVGWLYLQQCSSDMDKHFERYDIPQRAVERVKVRGNNGQYIIGSLEFKGSGETIWNPSLPARILRWQQDGLWITIGIRGDSALLYDKEDLLQLAESLR